MKTSAQKDKGRVAEQVGEDHRRADWGRGEPAEDRHGSWGRRTNEKKINDTWE